MFSMRKPKRRRALSLPIAIILAIVGSAALMAFLAVFSSRGVFHVSYVLPDGTELSEPVLRGSKPRNVPQFQIAGYSFVGWEDGEGQLVLSPDEAVYEDATYVAHYMPALNGAQHLPYLFTDDNGFLRPTAYLSRGEVAQIICMFLSALPQTGDNYEDVPADADYAQATAALRALEVVPGSSFRPEDAITLRELLSMFGHFFPLLSWENMVIYADGADPDDPATPYVPIYSFGDVSLQDPDYALFCSAAAWGWIGHGPELLLDPDEPIVRGQCALIINRALGRGVGLEPDENSTGLIPDLSPENPYYAELMEAAVPHSYSFSGNQEFWQSAEPFHSELEPGLMFIGTQMYCVTEDGYLVMDGSFDGFDFGPDGKFTSGMPELDELVQAALSEIITEGMTANEMLRAAYDYTVHNFTYTKGNYYKRGNVSWAEKEAYVMLSEGHNNCYGYAGVFYQLARALGQKPILISGLYGDNYMYHAWVEFETGGKRYICDPEVEMTYHRKDLQAPDMFMMTPDFATIWGYTK